MLVLHLYEVHIQCDIGRKILYSKHTQLLRCTFNHLISLVCYCDIMVICYLYHRSSFDNLLFHLRDNFFNAVLLISDDIKVTLSTKVEVFRYVSADNVWVTVRNEVWNLSTSRNNRSVSHKFIFYQLFKLKYFPILIAPVVIHG
ncbi:hypothetical protein D3C73_1316180 [compost metagenome]